MYPIPNNHQNNNTSPMYQTSGKKNKKKKKKKIADFPFRSGKARTRRSDFGAQSHLSAGWGWKKEKEKETNKQGKEGEKQKQRTWAASASSSSLAGVGCGCGCRDFLSLCCWWWPKPFSLSNGDFIDRSLFPLPSLIDYSSCLTILIILWGLSLSNLLLWAAMVEIARKEKGLDFASLSLLILRCSSMKGRLKMEGDFIVIAAAASFITLA